MADWAKKKAFSKTTKFLGSKSNGKLDGTLKKYGALAVGGKDDPLYANIKTGRGSIQKVRRQIPDFIPEKDAEKLANAKKWAYRYDMSVNLGVMRFGWSSIIGIIPELGDFIELIMAAHVFCLLWGISVVKWNLIKRMLINILVDFLIGLVPILGDLIDAYFKCNTRNVMIVEVELLEKFGPKSDEEKLHSVLGEPIGEPNDDLDEKPSRQSMGITEPRRPQHAHTGDNRGVGRWFSKVVTRNLKFD